MERVFHTCLVTILYLEVVSSKSPAQIEDAGLVVLGFHVTCSTGTDSHVTGSTGTDSHVTCSIDTDL